MRANELALDNICLRNKVNGDIYRHDVFKWATLYRDVPRGLHKHALVMRNANIDICSATANTDAG